jgi:prevent-host-death family protein
MADLVVSATEFKARCLSILDEVERSGRPVTVTKRGRPVATVAPPKTKRFPSLKGALAGKVKVPDEVFFTDYSDLWESVRGR